jgi:hypothetical protein
MRARKQLIVRSLKRQCNIAYELKRFFLKFILYAHNKNLIVNTFLVFTLTYREKTLPLDLKPESQNFLVPGLAKP